MSHPSAAVTGTVPSIADLERAMEVLRIPGDPGYLARDHTEPRQRAELLAHIAAWIVDSLRQAESIAELSIDDRADLHWDADLDIAAPTHQSPDTARLLNLQIARLAWVHHAIVRTHSPHPHEVIDTASTALGAITQLLETWRDACPAARAPGTDGATVDHSAVHARHPEQLDPMLADSLLMVRDAADQLSRVLRTRPQLTADPALVTQRRRRTRG